MKSIFIGAGGLRSGWRFLLFLLGTLTLQGVVQWIVISVFRYQPAKGWTSSDLLLSEAIAVFVVWLTTFLTARIEKTSVAAYGLPRPGAFRTQWIEGLLWGALAPALAMAMIVAAGAARIDGFALQVLGAPNTGNEGKPVADHFLDTHFTGAAWITGGPRGIEASAFMFVVIAVLFAAALLRWRGKPVERRPPSAAEA